jgi:pimeloyl-ACP methyl ester carboxylesterase
MRAREPEHEGFVDRDGVKVAYEVFGDDNATAVLLLPTWAIVHSRAWKAQVGYLARHFRVVTFDGRGNGRTDRPSDSSAYSDAEYVADAVAVLDATGTERAVAMGSSMGGVRALLLAAGHPDRVSGVVALGAAVPHLFDEAHADGADADPSEPNPFDADLEEYEGWAKYNRHHWLRSYDDFLQFFFPQVFSEPHSTKQIEDSIAWAHETDGETLVRTADAPATVPDRATAEAMCRAVRCPVLLVHGDNDNIVPLAVSERIAELTGGTLVTVGAGGHISAARDPVFVNRLLRDFVDRVAPARGPRHRTWTRALARP